MRMTRGWAGVVNASAQSFRRITTPHTGVWKGRDSGGEYRLFSPLVQNALSRCELWHHKCHMGSVRGFCDSWLGVARESKSEECYESFTCHLDRSLDGAMRVRRGNTECQGRARSIAANRDRERSAPHAHRRSTAPRTAVARLSLIHIFRNTLTWFAPPMVT